MMNRIYVWLCNYLFLFLVCIPTVALCFQQIPSLSHHSSQPKRNQRGYIYSTTSTTFSSINNYSPLLREYLSKSYHCCKDRQTVLYTTSNSEKEINVVGATQNNNNNNNRALGVLVLLTVPLAWGTYAPVVKYVYEMNPPVPGFVFSGAYYMIAALTLSLLAFLQQQITTTMPSKTYDDDDDSTTFQDELIIIQESDQNIIMSSNSILNKPPIQFWAGLELGSYLFIGNCLQVVGLKTVPADRAAFLVQLTTIMVPLFQALFAGDLGTISLNTWLACFMAFIGVIIMGFDGPDVQSFDVQSLLSGVGEISFSGGDLLIVTAAVAYTMHVIRLGQYAKFTTPLDLAASKACIEALLSIGLVSFLMFIGQSDISFLNEMSTEITTYFRSIREQISLGQFPPNDSTKVIGAVLWTGWITCAYTIYAQSFGQRRVSPTDANLIYSMQPLFSALFAFILLGESLGVAGYIGGSFIAAALWIVTSSNEEEIVMVDVDKDR